MFKLLACIYKLLCLFAQALNASATSGRAMALTSKALDAAASEQTSELLGLLTKVAADMRASKAGPKAEAAVAAALEAATAAEAGAPPQVGHSTNSAATRRAFCTSAACA